MVILCALRCGHLELSIKLWAILLPDLLVVVPIRRESIVLVTSSAGPLVPVVVLNPGIFIAEPAVDPGFELSPRRRWVLVVGCKLDIQGAYRREFQSRARNIEVM